MAINVVCPGCLKRFQVSDRFAGMKGPCPSCNTIINIPKAAVKIHGAEEFDQGGKTATGRSILKPIERLDTDFNPVRAGLIALGTLVVFMLAFFVGRMDMSLATRDWVGLIGLLLLSFPLSLFGYQVLRDREQLFVVSGEELYKKTGLCALAYVALWVLFESFAWYMGAGEIFIWVCWSIFAVLSVLAAHALLDIVFGSAFLHYLIFFTSVVLLRGLSGLGWIWVVADTVKKSGAPVLPGM